MEPSRRPVPAGAFACFLVVWLAGTGAFAGGAGWFDTRFFTLEGPGVSQEELLDGSLGILAPSFETPALFVAWRLLMGFETSEDERAVLTRAFEPHEMPDIPRAGTPESWQYARRQVVENSEIWQREYADRTFRRQVVLDAEMQLWNTGDPCRASGYSHASGTLRARIRQYGRDSREVAEWLWGRDQVFANCDRRGVIPEPLDGAWPMRLRHDRAYQIAAALFYSERLDDAFRHFSAIAEDPTSEWAGLSAYLAGITLVRADRLDEATLQFERVLDDPAFDEYHGTSRGMLFRMLAWRDPVRALERVARDLSGPQLVGVGFKRQIDDLRILSRSTGTQEELPSEPLAEWILGVGGRLEIGDMARAWIESPSTPRRVALLVQLDGGDVPAELDDDPLERLLGQAAASDLDAPSGWSERFHHARILGQLGRVDEAKAALEAMMADPRCETKLGRSDHNRFRRLRADLADSFADWLRWQQMPPVSFGHSARIPARPGDWRPMDPEQVHFSDYEFTGGPGDGPLFTHEAARALNLLTPLQLLELWRDGAVDPELELLFLRTAWTRAVVLPELSDEADPFADDAAAILSARELEHRDPLLGREMAALVAAPAVQRPILAYLTVLRSPGLHPDFHGGLWRLMRPWWTDTLRDLHPMAGHNWWHGILWREPAKAADPATLLRFDLDQASLKEVAAAVDGLQSVVHDLGPQVLDFANRHPDVPGVAEALHLLVRSTRYGAGRGPFGEVSKAAFDLLHRRYRGSRWTERTPYWYD